MSHRDKRDHEPRGRWRWDRIGREGWKRSRISGGFGSQYDAWSQGAGFRPPDYRGRGPSTYRRADERIHEEACERLTDDPSVDASNITVQVHDGEITLSGTVASRGQKRLAEDCVESIRGVHDVINQLTVAREGPERGGPNVQQPGVAADRGQRR